MATIPQLSGLCRDSSTQQLCITLPVQGQAQSFQLAAAAVAFYNGSRIQSSSLWRQCFNRAVARWAGQLTHVELAFRFVSAHDRAKECWIACCIYTGEMLHFEAKTHKFTEELRDNLWTLVGLNVGQPLIERLLLDCVADVQRGIAFNSALYWNFFVPAPLRYNGALEQVAWCSEHVATRLRALELPGLTNLDSQHLTPQRLYDYLNLCGYNQPFFALGYRAQLMMAQMV